MNLGGDDAKAADGSSIDELDSSAIASRPSRSQQTREATEANRLGIKLSGLSSAELDRLALPQRIRDEIVVCQQLKPRSRGRQNRLIGQLLRAEGPEVVRERFESMKKGRRDGVQHEKETELWVGRIVIEGDSAIESLIAEYPNAERQRLRALARNARQEPVAKKAKRARRELIQVIRTLRDFPA